MEMSIILVLSILFIVAIGWFAVNGMDKFIWDNMRKNHHDYECYDHSAPIRVMDESFVKKCDEKENHILVCLSAAPSNENIVRVAAKIAEKEHARFTALYVQTGNPQEKEDMERLKRHIHVAEQLGAEIASTHGDDIALQITEFARLSNVTKIIIGKNNAKRRHIWSRPTLAEQLLDAVPGIDVYIISDSESYRPYREKNRFMHRPGSVDVRDIGFVIVMLTACTLIGFALLKLGFTETNIVMLYILGVLLISVVTRGYLYSVISSFLSVFLFGFFLTEPRLSFQTYAVGYPVTFVVMLLVAIITGTLAAKLKAHAKISAQLAFRMQILFDTNRLLQRERNRTDMLRTTCEQLAKLFECSITAYIVKDQKLSEGILFAGKETGQEGRLLSDDERNVVEWVYQNKRRAGATTERFSDASCLYMAICTDDTVYGVVGIPMKEKSLDSFAYSILLSLLNECALAMENEHNLKEREKAAVFAKNEQLRADLLRSISHDLRTPLCAISGNADTLLHNGAGLDDVTKQQIYTDIYDDSEWLVGVVENLLSVTRLNDNRLKLNLTDQLVDEVIEEAVRHVSRQAKEHTIHVNCEELILARMDARLIIQVLVNLIENAVKYTQKGSEIQISAHRQGKKVCISVADNGEGISDEMKQHVFEMFYTGKNTVADSRRSLGLGLALCRSIVEAHGGNLTLADNHPHGCIFTFTLPVSEVTLNE